MVSVAGLSRSPTHFEQFIPATMLANALHSPPVRAQDIFKGVSRINPKPGESSVKMLRLQGKTDAIAKLRRELVTTAE